MKRLLILLLAAILCVGTFSASVGCNSNSTDNGGADIENPSTIKTSLTLSKSSIEIEEGEQFYLTANVTPSDMGVIWSTDDESVAEVNGNGKVTAIKKGIAKITATTTDNKCSAFCYVTVNAKHQPPAQQESIVLSKTEVIINVGDTYLLNALVTPSNSQITWSSTDEKTVTVNNGMLTGISAGTAFIQATTEGGVSAVCTVEVKEVYGTISGTITCRNKLINIDDVDVNTKIYLISYEAEEVQLNAIMMGFDYNFPAKGIYQVAVDTAGAYKIENIVLGKYRMIITCSGKNYRVSSTGDERKKVLGDIYNKGDASQQNRVDTSTLYDAQMSGFNVTVGKNPLTITRRVYGVYEGANVT